ncbi:MAG: hypothetical protein LLG01_11540 [Planctomycetaceae bacterium]|nr:hypothetical protein [Planctomycetaceae bacterium]
MLINCYYYAPHNHCLLRRHIEADLEQMKSIGTHAVSVCVQEEQLTNWHHKRLENFIRQAHGCGLQVHAVPNRWGGLTAGWLDGFSSWTLEHRDLPMAGQEQQGCCDPARPELRRHYEETLRLMLTMFEFDGLIWDEPRPPTQSVIEFLDEMSALAKSLRPALTVSMFAEAGALHLAEVFARTRHIDYLGADGHLRDQTHQMHRMKNTIFQTHAVFHPVLSAAGKKTLFLLEAQRHRNEDLANYLSVVDRAFALPMDHLMYYFSAHEMSLENEEQFNRATWQAVSHAATVT